jgi:hypothetical protein
MDSKIMHNLILLFMFCSTYTYYTVGILLCHSYQSVPLSGVVDECILWLSFAQHLLDRETEKLWTLKTVILDWSEKENAVPQKTIFVLFFGANAYKVLEKERLEPKDK